MNNRKYFGTDGIRGKVGIPPITPDFVLRLGWAAGKVLASSFGSKQIIIGKDTRLSGYMLESALEAGLAASGISAGFTGPLPTPAIAYLTRILHAEAGIVISASHNPFYDNGIKFFSSTGEKLADDVEKAIESEMEKKITCVSSIKFGRAIRIEDAARRYMDFCKSTFPNELSLEKLKIVVDCANGATYHVAPNILRDLGATVIPIFVEPNGMNINKKCGATDLRVLQKCVLEETADLGFAYDGDGDRILMVDHLGDKINGDQILYIVARESLREGRLGTGGVVGTSMSNLGLEFALERVGIPFVRAKVGDRYVLEMMKQKGWNIGAESSGHIILLDKISTGDGILAGLQVLSAMVRHQISLRDLCSDLKMFPQVLVNVSCCGIFDSLKNQRLESIMRNTEKKLRNEARVVLRKSGTEPFVRIMVEGKNKIKINELAYRIANEIKNFNP